MLGQRERGKKLSPLTVSHLCFILSVRCSSGYVTDFSAKPMDLLHYEKEPSASSHEDAFLMATFPGSKTLGLH